MVLRVGAALRASRAADVVAVLRPGDSAARALLEEVGLPSTFAEHPDEGRAASVRAGVRAVPVGQGVLFALADQPWLEPVDFDALIAAAESCGIAYASYEGERGSPVCFGPEYRDELLQLRGGEGGRVVLERHRARARAVPIDPEHGRDVDRSADLR